MLRYLHIERIIQIDPAATVHCTFLILLVDHVIVSTESSKELQFIMRGMCFPNRSLCYDVHQEIEYIGVNSCMKRLLSIDELIEHMKGKGIKFDLYSEDEARSFLRQNNYFMKVSAYRRLYPKCPPESKRPGEYQNLDFAYLVELSTIDVHLRYLILQMCLDIEHFIKVHLMTHATDNPQED